MPVNAKTHPSTAKATNKPLKTDMVKRAPFSGSMQGEVDAPAARFTLIDQLDALDRDVAQLSDDLNNLGRVISPVMIGEQPESGEVGYPYTLSSPVGTRLEQMQAFIIQLSRRVRTMTERVELV